MNNLTVSDVENYLNRIFDLQSELMDKEFKIASLEFELIMEKQLLSAFKKHYLHGSFRKNKRDA